MDNKLLDLTSQELTDIPKSVFEEKEIKKILLDFNSIPEIPPLLFTKLPHLSCISLNGNMVETLPSDIDKLISLEELYLKENLLCELPKSIVSLKHLRKLHITGNQIKSLPEKFSLLENLSELIADENEIENLPSDFGELQHLCHLELSYNNVSQLPDNFGNLSSLKEFSMSNNSLTSLPSSFQNLSSVEVMDLSYNSLVCLPETFFSAEKLRKLLLCNNSICAVPEWFSNLSTVTEIDIHSNALQDTPFQDNFGDICCNLEHLDVRGNNLTGLPPSFGNLKCLKKLHLGSAGEPERNRYFSAGNSILKLPESFPQLLSLTVLELDENSLTILPEDFGCLSNIIYLNLSHNDLRKLPDSFCDLQQLKVCLLSINFLAYLPDNFGNLSSLEELKIDENMLIRLPESFSNLSNLVSLDLYHNKLKEIPPCLQHLKSLKILDLKENDFNLNLDEIPDFNISARYLARKPELKNNWRGRKREDIGDSLWVTEEQQAEGRDKENDVLSYALKYSSSLWKRHGDEGIRKPSKMVNGCITDMDNLNLEASGISSSIDEDRNENEREFWDNDLLDVPSTISSSSRHSSLQDNSEIFNYENSSEASDWEEELEKMPTFKKIYMHPVKTELSSEFVPSDIHARHIARGEVWDCVEDGQFDDADL